MIIFKYHNAYCKFGLERIYKIEEVLKKKVFHGKRMTKSLYKIGCNKNVININSVCEYVASK